MSLTLLAAVSLLNDATTIMTAVTPLVHQALANGETEISDDAIAAARAKLSGDIAALDAAIAKASQP